MSVDELMQKIMLAECDGCKKLKWTNELFVNAAVMNGAKLCTIAYVSNLQQSKINELVDVVNDLTAVVNILSAKIEELEYGRL